MHALNCFVTEYCSCICTGKGVLGLYVPGCPETFEEPRSSRSRQGSRHQEQQQQPDSHQKIRRFNKGDIIAIPAGTPYWTYNHGNEPLIAISLLDTSNYVNQLDSTPRVSISITIIHYIMYYKLYLCDVVAETYKTFILLFTSSNCNLELLYTLLSYKIFNSINDM